jgi:CBS domain containing-hemolysin-like protein
VIARFLAILALLAANGFFVAAEFALVRSRRTRLEALARSGDRKARRVLRVLGNLGRSLSAAQLGISLCSLALGALTYDAVASSVHGWLEGLPVALEVSLRVVIGAILALLVVAYVHVVFGELTPRAIALASPERVARWLMLPLIAFAWLTTPLTAFINWSARLMRLALGLHADVAEEVVHSADELRTLVEQSEETGMIDAQNATLIEGVFEFREKTAREVMTPRTEIDALPVESTLEETATFVEETQRSRYPLYDETIDNIVGVVLAKDLLPVLHRPPPDFSLRSITRPIHLVPGSREVIEVLGDFKRLKEHMAVVLDEYGGTAGLVTMEDLLEEIVGDILDEHDETEEPDIPVIGEDVCVPGSLHITDLNERFALEVPDDDFTTIGGFVFGTLGRLPVIGDRVTAGGAVFTVRAMEGRRVETLAVDLHTLGDRREKPRDTEIADR